MSKNVGEVYASYFRYIYYDTGDLIIAVKDYYDIVTFVKV